jgi:choloylglycine hydrolase
LSFEALYLPNETEYQTVPAGQQAHSIPYLSSGDWILGNFKNVDEVKVALASLYIYAEKIPQAQDMIFPLHFAVFDPTGKGIVIEFVKGKMNVHDNPVGVMTNAPTFNWQVTNLRNYINLMPTTPQPIVTKNITFIATGQGSGMHGLPGDVSPPSRFVKMAVMLKSIITPANAEEALNVAQHIINNVDIPLGYVRSDVDINATSNEYTQWTDFKDLTHKKFYYHTYGDTALHMVDMSKLNLAEGAPQMKMPISSKQNIIDMTQALQASQ